MLLTRRDVSRLILACTALTASAAVPVSADENAEWAKRLTRDLDRSLKRGCNGKFTVVGFGQAKRGDGSHHFRTAVKLDWPPGTRCRLFDAINGSEDSTYEDLLQQARDEFQSAWPDCVV